MRCLQILIMLFLYCLLGACGDYRQGYKKGQKKGYEAGFTEGQSKGQEAGYKEGTAHGEKQGYARGYAAASSPSGGSNAEKHRQVFYRAMPILSFILVMGNLFLLLVDTVRGGIGWGERFGRGLLIPIAPIFLFWSTEDFRRSVKSTLLDLLLQPRSPSFSGAFILLISSATLLFVVFFVLLKMCEKASGHLVPSLLIILTSTLLSLLGPFLWTIMFVPNLKNCRLIDSAIGIVIGGLAVTAVILHSRYLDFDSPLGLMGLFGRLSKEI